jgi:hypothetical protein
MVSVAFGRASDMEANRQICSIERPLVKERCLSAGDHGEHAIRSGQDSLTLRLRRDAWPVRGGQLARKQESPHGQRGKQEKGKSPQ